ncbi:MAG: hypothetical protein OXC30_05530 [Alphaproteobacteria bacterium]|nr:hypothetical protein [Alphaproteobacteria bacterium]
MIQGGGEKIKYCLNSLIQCAQPYENEAERERPFYCMIQGLDRLNVDAFALHNALDSWEKNKQ